MAMRRLAILLLFLPAFAFAADALRFETRSQTHSLAVEARNEQYDVRVIDLASGQLLAAAKFDAGNQSEKVTEAGDLRVRVRFSEASNGITVRVDIEKSGVLIDAMSSFWMIKGHEMRSDMSAPLRVGGDVKAPIVISKTEPAYTDEARKARISGIVIAEAVIDKSGTVRDVRILKPLPFGLDQSAADALRQWKFYPGTLNGQPVDVIFNVTVNFKLEVPKTPRN